MATPLYSSQPLLDGGHPVHTQTGTAHPETHPDSSMRISSLMSTMRRARCLGHYVFVKTAGNQFRLVSN